MSRTLHRHNAVCRCCNWPAAMSVAWEQVEHWKTFMTLEGARQAVGLSGARPAWENIARRLAIMWLDTLENKEKDSIPAVHRDVDGIQVRRNLAA